MSTQEPRRVTTEPTKQAPSLRRHVAVLELCTVCFLSPLRASVQGSRPFWHPPVDLFRRGEVTLVRKWLLFSLTQKVTHAAPLDVRCYRLFDLFATPRAPRYPRSYCSPAAWGLGNGRGIQPAARCHQRRSGDSTAGQNSRVPGRIAPRVRAHSGLTVALACNPPRRPCVQFRGRLQVTFGSARLLLREIESREFRHFWR